MDSSVCGFSMASPPRSPRDVIAIVANNECTQRIYSAEYDWPSNGDNTWNVSHGAQAI